MVKRMSRLARAAGLTARECLVCNIQWVCLERDAGRQPVLARDRRHRLSTLANNSKWDSSLRLMAWNDGPNVEM
jgi:hypothetical protein